VVAGQPISLRSDRAYRTGLFLRRHKLSVTAATLAVLGLIATTGWALWQTRQAAERAREATLQTRIADEQAEIARKEALASESVSDLLVSAFDAADPSMRKSVAEPTAKDVLDASAANLDEQLGESPALLARMQMILGRAYMNLGYSDKATRLLAASVEQFLGKDVHRPDKAAEALSLLAQTETDLKNGARAVAVAKRGLALRQSIHASPEDVADATNTLGMTLIAAVRYAEAERVLRSVLDLNSQLYGTPSYEVANALNNLAQLSSNSGKLKEAEPLFRRSLEMKERIKANPETLFGTRSLLAVALGRMGRFDEALRLLALNETLAPSFYPAESNWHATLLERFGDVYRAKGDLPEAQDRYQRAIAVREALGVAPSPDKAIVLLRLAEVLEARGDIRAAQKYFVLAKRMRDEVPTILERMSLRIEATQGVFLLQHGFEGASPDKLGRTLDRWIGLYQQTGRNVPWDAADARFKSAEYRLATKRPETVEAVLPVFDPDPEQPLQQAWRHYYVARAHAARGDVRKAISEYDQAVKSVDALTGRQSAYAALWRLDYIEMLIDGGLAKQARAQSILARPVLTKQMLPRSAPILRMERLERKIAGML